MERIVDHCIFMKAIGRNFIILVLYVDYVLFVVNDVALLYVIMKFLFDKFEMKDMSETSYVIGLKIFCNRSQSLSRFS